MQFAFVAFALAFTTLISFAVAESHTVRFENRCCLGTPTLIVNGQVVSTGEDFTSNGPLSGIAYLQTGACNFNGENCVLLETTLINPAVPGGGSSTDISLIEPHAFQVPTGFSYFNGCDGAGAVCDNPSCNAAFRLPEDTLVQVQCEDDDVGLLITFC